MKYFLVGIVLILIFNQILLPQNGITEVAIVAPSVSTSMKAREICQQKNWQEIEPKCADYLLVVVRSELIYPLQIGYDSFFELNEEAEMQLNISGSNFHIYLFFLENDLSVTEVDHIYFEAEDW